MHQQLRGCKVEERLHFGGMWTKKSLNTTGIEYLKPYDHAYIHIHVTKHSYLFIPRPYFQSFTIVLPLAVNQETYKRTYEFILRPPLWSSGQSSWLQIQRYGFDSRRYQIFWEVVDLERGPLSLVSTIEELLGRKKYRLLSRKPRLRP
jgi:hypothetical protein